MSAAAMMCFAGFIGILSPSSEAPIAAIDVNEVTTGLVAMEEAATTAVGAA